MQSAAYIDITKTALVPKSSNPNRNQNSSPYTIDADARVCTTKTLSTILTGCLQVIKDKRMAYCNVIYKTTGVNQMWILKNSKELLEKFDLAKFSKAKCISTWDFSTLYTSIPHRAHRQLKKQLFAPIRNTMSKSKYSVMNYRSNKCFLGSKSYDSYMSFTCDDLCDMLSFLINNIYVIFGDTIMRQVIGIPMGTDCAPLLADLFLHSYEAKFLSDLIKDKKTRHVARIFNRTDRYIDDLFSADNDKFGEYVPKIYPKELVLKKTNEDPKEAEYLDLLININVNDELTTKLYDKRDAFGFDIVNFPYLDSNIPSGPAYGVYVSQLVRYSRACCNYGDFSFRHSLLIKRLLNQGYKRDKLSKYFLKFYNKYSKDMNKYNKDNVSILVDVGLQ